MATGSNLTVAGGAGILLLTIGIVGAGGAAASSDTREPISGSRTAASAPQQPSPAPPATAPASLAQPASSTSAMLKTHCFGCHNSRVKAGGLVLDSLDLARVGDAPAVWEKVVRKMRAGVMPPVAARQPTPEARAEFVTELEARLDREAAAAPNPGRSEPIHRLNRAEYQNAIRDLLLLDINAAELLPADDASYGFDNIAGVLKLSPVLLERYLSAAQKISRLAVGSPPPSPSGDVYRLPGDLPQYGRAEGLALGTRGGVAIPYTFPRDAEYAIRIELLKNRDSRFYVTEPHQLEVNIDGERVRVFTVEPQTGRAAPQDTNADTEDGPERSISGVFELRVPVKAGPRVVGVAFVHKTSALDEKLRQPFLRVYNASYLEYLVSVGSVTVTGPFDAVGVSDTPSRNRIFVCRPARIADETGCAEKIISTIARRAYRRPVTKAEVDPLLALYGQGRKEAGFEAGIERALQQILVSPGFLFRVERDAVRSEDGFGVAAPAAPYRITDIELASRLSFFLWSSVPDDELIDLASRGVLNQAPILEKQVRRMLADPRSGALSTNFASQWLHLRNLPAVVPYEVMFPDFDEGLRRAMRQETELFFDSIVRENRPVLDLMSADYTFLNERLARHYGIPHVYGTHFRRVPLTDERRRGLLGQASILSVTSQANRTSPVNRGKFILENLLGTPPPPPPPNVPPLADKDKSGARRSVRELMAAHRASPVCASCHNMMDPPGLALENFDAVGRWRDTDAGAAIDATGSLPDGTKFDGVVGLRRALLKNENLIVTTLTEKLLTYALGRGLEYYDVPAVRRIVREAANDKHRFASLALGVVKSLPFQMRRAQS
jgi:mono/diheme cytochrome c family protein